jgi:hypothetical protein
MAIKESLSNFARTIYRLAKSDRDVTMGVAGFTGEGKSTFLIQLQKEYAKHAKTKYTLTNNLTWSREELFKWIDGDKKGNGKKPEYSALNADELISMFFNRNWQEDKQIASIEKLNKCRDRHLFIGGNVPVIWQLDSALLTRLRFYGYIPRGRSRAWIFEQEDNPFSKDPWNIAENQKTFRRNKNPYKCPNFVCEVEYTDLSVGEKKEYLDLRNTKRLNTEMQNKKDRVLPFKRLIAERNALIRYLDNKKDILKINGKLIGDICGMNKSTVCQIINGGFGIKFDGVEV